jgi:hypothetical protein
MSNKKKEKKTLEVCYYLEFNPNGSGIVAISNRDVALGERLFIPKDQKGIEVLITSQTKQGDVTYCDFQPTGLELPLSEFEQTFGVESLDGKVNDDPSIVKEVMEFTSMPTTPTKKATTAKKATATKKATTTKPKTQKPKVEVKKEVVAEYDIKKGEFVEAKKDEEKKDE